MNYLHTIKIAHWDIKLENMIFSDKTNWCVKLIDFGLATHFTKDKMIDHIGTPYYVCPEILEKKGYNEKCDIWSMGVSMVRALTGWYPFEGDDFEELVTSIRFKDPNIGGNVSTHGHDLMKKMLTKNPKLRPSTREIL